MELHMMWQDKDIKDDRELWSTDLAYKHEL